MAQARCRRWVFAAAVGASGYFRQSRRGIAAEAAAGLMYDEWVDGVW